MLQIQVLKEKPDWVKERLAVRNFKQPELVDEIIRLDEQRRALQVSFDTTQAKINSASKEIGKLMSTGKKEEAEALKNEVADNKKIVASTNEQLSQTEKELQYKLVQLPNLPSQKVPAGTSPEDNVVVKENGAKPNLYAGAKPHWDLIKQYNLVDFETGAKITGSGFPLYKGAGAKLQRALVQYFLDYNTERGYTNICRRSW